MNDDSHFLMSMGAALKNEGKEYHGQRCVEIAAEIERLRVELAWWKQKPQEDCDSKCEYGKHGDPKGCYCGRAEWHAKRPAHLTIVDG